MITVTVARRPMATSTVASSVLVAGTGALSIDASRVAPVVGEHVGPGSWSDPSKRSGEVGSDLGITHKGVAAFQQAQAESVERANRLGRWPANLLLEHLVGCQATGASKDVRRDVKEKSCPFEGKFLSGVGSRTVGKTTEVVPIWKCEPGCPVANLDAQGGDSITGVRANKDRVQTETGATNFTRGVGAPEYPNDRGGAARYFKQIRGETT